MLFVTGWIELHSLGLCFNHRLLNQSKWDPVSNKQRRCNKGCLELACSPCVCCASSRLSGFLLQPKHACWVYWNCKFPVGVNMSVYISLAMSVHRYRLTDLTPFFHGNTVLSNIHRVSSSFGGRHIFSRSVHSKLMLRSLLCDALYRCQTLTDVRSENECSQMKN